MVFPLKKNLSKCGLGLSDIPPSGVSSRVLVFLWFPEPLAVQSLPRHLDNGLNFRIHIQDTSFAKAPLILSHEIKEKGGLW